MRRPRGLEMLWGPGLASVSIMCHQSVIMCHQSLPLPLPHGTMASSGATAATQMVVKQQEADWGKSALEDTIWKSE